MCPHRVCLVDLDSSRDAPLMHLGGAEENVTAVRITRDRVIVVYMHSVEVSSVACAGVDIDKPWERCKSSNVDEYFFLKNSLKTKPNIFFAVVHLPGLLPAS